MAWEGQEAWPGQVVKVDVVKQVLLSGGIRPPASWWGVYVFVGRLKGRACVSRPPLACLSADRFPVRPMCGIRE